MACPATRTTLRTGRNGDGAFRVMRAALKDAKLPGRYRLRQRTRNSTPIGDAIETRAMKRLFGDRACRRSFR